MKRFLLLSLFVFAFSIGVSAATRVLVNLVNFQDDQRTPFTREHAEAEMAQVTQFFADISPVRFEVTVNDWRTLPINGTCDAEILKAQVDTSDDKTVIAFPKRSCGFAGQASEQTVLINTDRFGANIVAHELGHTYGMAHAARINADGSIEQYGDFFDVMGTSSRLNYFNAFQREKAGWITLPVVGSGAYVIPSYGAVKVWVRDLYPLSYDEYYMVEYRDPFGFDSWMRDYGVQNGVIIRRVWDTSYLIDTTPNSDIGDLEWLDAPLTVGRTFADSDFSVTLLSIDTGGATVSITAPAVQPSPLPSPTPTPSPTPEPTPSPSPVCVRANPQGKCLKWR